VPTELTWRKAIEKVLSEAPGAMHYQKITEKIIQDGLRSNLGATPAATVAAAASTAIKNEEDGCPFQRIGKGLFIWKAKAGITQQPSTPVEEPEQEDEVQYDVISSFGMFWRREAIEWVATPKILGMQQIGAKPVDFHEQLGIYLLYDGREVIYVGRATERPLGKRLYEHTADRLSSRWDRFSWFGLLPVSESGDLGILPESYLGPKIIPAVEAILIEALEPRQNRKRGDDLSAVEYIQKEDPEIQKKRVKQSLEAALGKWQP
jgi:HB1, ASXL, restriction endonuclease HTH domain